jgi:diguanylate cyclase (GGDEF)-like protein
VAPENHLRALLDLSSALSSSLDLEDVLHTFKDHAAQLTGATASEVSFWDRERNGVVMLLEHLSGTAEVTRDGGTLYSLEDYPATRHVLETQMPMQVSVSNLDDDESERALLESRKLRSLLMLPLVSRGETIGLLELVDAQDRKWSEYDIEFIRAMCDIVASAVRNAMLFEKVQEMSLLDEVTKLYNRRCFEEQIESAVARSRRNKEPLALLVIDLDGLKRINDLGGHQAGDVALRAAADSLRAATRVGDTPCRLGGDEFAVILPGATKESALTVSDRAQAKLAEIGRGQFSFSGGVAFTAHDGATAYELYRSADIAAYRAKTAGGARTEMAKAS